MRACVAGLISAAMVVAVSALNPWGLNSVSGKAAQDAIQRLTVDAYPVAHARKPGERITVITIDEAGVEALEDAGWAGWPPGLENLGLMLSDVTRNSGPLPGEVYPATFDQPEQGFRGARAVFADFWVDGPPERQPGEILTEMGPDGERPNARGLALQQFDGFVETLGGLTRSKDWSHVPECRADAAMKIACIVAAGGVPVIMAQSSDAHASRVGTRPVQASATNTARLQSVVVLASVKIDEVAAEMIEPTASGNGFGLSPPAALWLASCLTDVDRGGTCPELPEASDLLDRAEIAMKKAAAPLDPTIKVPALDTEAALRGVWPEPMSVIWSGREAADQDRLQRQTSSSPPPACRSSASWPRRVIEAFLGQVEDVGARRACLPHKRMEYDRLVSGMGLPQADYDLLLRDRIVLVGSHFDSADWISTPVHGRVPGVHWHAMAADNLLSFGRDYRRADAGLFSWGTFWEALIAFAVAALTSLLVDWTKRATEAGGRPRPLLITGAAVAVCLTAALGVLLLLPVVWTSFPVNWIAILSICVIAAATLVEEATSHRIGPQFDRRVREPLLRLFSGRSASPLETEATAPPDAPASPPKETPETP